jgi:flagellar biosynthesis/type III secretory pathway chaperone
MTDSVNTPTVHTTLTDRVALAQARAQRLLTLLGDEFAALKAQQIDTFEQLQPGKSELLTAMGILTGVTGQDADSADRPLSDPAWDTFKGIMVQCRDAHRRNELLIARQLDAIRGLANSVASNAHAATTKPN